MKNFLLKAMFMLCLLSLRNDVFAFDESYKQDRSDAAKKTIKEKVIDAAKKFKTSIEEGAANLKQKLMGRPDQYVQSVVVSKTPIPEEQSAKIKQTTSVAQNSLLPSQEIQKKIVDLQLEYKQLEGSLDQAAVKRRTEITEQLKKLGEEPGAKKLATGKFMPTPFKMAGLAGVQPIKISENSDLQATTKKPVISTIHKRIAGFAGLGSGLLLALIVSGGVTAGALSNKSNKKDLLNGYVLYGLPRAITPISIYPAISDGASDDEKGEYCKNIALIAGAFSNASDGLKNALDNSDYNDSVFRISLGQVLLDKPTDVAIEYDFGQGGTGNIGTPLAPVKVTLYPKEVNGVAVSLGHVLHANPIIAPKLLTPSPYLIFIIKAILLNNTVCRNSKIKNDYDCVREILTQTALLYFRLGLVGGFTELSDDIFMDTSRFSSIGDYTDKLTTKMYPEFIDYFWGHNFANVLNIYLNLQRTQSNYIARTEEFRNLLLPTINKGVSHFEQSVFFYALLKHVADLGYELDKSDLQLRTDGLITLLDQAIVSMKKNEFDANGISQLEKALNIQKDIRALKLDVTQNIKQPRFGDPVLPLQETSFVSALIYYVYQSEKLINAKHKGDSAYIYNNMLLGKYETVNAILAAILRATDDVLKAEKMILESDKALILFRKQDKQYVVNHIAEYNKLLQDPIKDLELAQKEYDIALEAVRKLPNDAKKRTTYEDANNKLTLAAKALGNALLQYRVTYAPYFLLTREDGSKTTPVEALKHALNLVRKHGHPDGLKMFNDIYKQVQPALGIPVNQIWVEKQ